MQLLNTSGQLVCGCVGAGGSGDTVSMATDTIIGKLWSVAWVSTFSGTFDLTHTHAGVMTSLTTSGNAIGSTQTLRRDVYRNAKRTIYSIGSFEYINASTKIEN